MLSIIVLTKNEEDIIGDCLAGLQGFADEILVIDAYSSDKTKEIAQKEGARVLENNFVNFSDQRNFGLDKSKGDWVLYIDSDEIVTHEFKEEVRRTIKDFNESTQITGYFIKRKNYFFGKDWNYTDKVQRLFLKKELIGWKGTVHETPSIKGQFSIINAPVKHFTHRNLHQMVAKTNEWSDFEADLRIKANHPKMNVFRFIRIMLTGFFQSYFKEKGYKNGIEGIIEGIYQSFSMFITYSKLWERQIER